MLRREATRLGLPRDFKIYDADDQTAVVKLALEQLKIKDPESASAACWNASARRKIMEWTPAQVASDAANSNDALGINRLQGV